MSKACALTARPPDGSSVIQWQRYNETIEWRLEVNQAGQGSLCLHIIDVNGVMASDGVLVSCLGSGPKKLWVELVDHWIFISVLRWPQRDRGDDLVNSPLVPDVYY